jgi:hypothetical protein
MIFYIQYINLFNRPCSENRYRSVNKLGNYEFMHIKGQHFTQEKTPSCLVFPCFFLSLLQYQTFLCENTIRGRHGHGSRTGFVKYYKPNDLHMYRATSDGPLRRPVELHSFWDYAVHVATASSADGSHFHPHPSLPLRS